MKPKIILLLLLTALSAFIFFFYQKYYLPRQIIKNSLKNLETIKSFEFSADLSLLPNTLIKSKGQVDFQKGVTSSSEIQLNNNPLSLDTVFIDNNFFIKIYDTKIEYFSKIKNNWFEISPSYLPSLYAGKGYKINFDSSTKEKFVASFKQNSPVSLKLFLQNEKLNSRDVYHLKYNVDKTKFLDAIKALSNDSDFSKDLEANVENSIQNLTFKVGDLWIDKKDKLPRKITFEAREEKQDLKIYRFELTFSNYNQNFTIQKPDEVVKMEDVL
jgi:hypothetical protein